VRPSTPAGIDYDELAKALLDRIPPGTRTQTMTPAQIAAAQNGMSPRGTRGSLGWADPLVPFGPGMPITPYPIDPPDPKTGTVAPRRSEYMVSWNLPGVTDREVPWTVLRRIANTSLVRRCIEVRKAEVVALDWTFGVSPRAIQRAMLSSNSKADRQLAVKAAQGDPQAKSDLKASKTRQRIEQTIREKNADGIARLQDWWKMPDPLNEWDFADWINAVLEEHFVLDALTLYPHPARNGTLAALEVIAGDTIKPLLDHRGATPQPPDPAYQQILHGFPRGEFTACGGADGEYDKNALIYRPRFRRASSPYGYSNVEQVIVDVDIYMRRQEWIRAEYTSGVVPEMFVTTDSPMTPEYLLAYERILNDALSGMTSERHRAKILPAGFTPVFPNNFEQRYRPELDLFLIRMIALGFDVMPSELGFPPTGGLGGKGFGEAEENITYRKATLPMSQWLSSVIDGVSCHWMGMSGDLGFQFLGLESEDEKMASETDANRFKVGGTTVNEMRDKQGLPRYDIPEADIPFIVTGRDVIPLEGAVDRANVVLQPPAPGPGGSVRKPGEKPSTDQPGAQGKPTRARTATSTTSITLDNARNNKAAEVKAAEVKAFKTYIRNRRRDPDRNNNWRDFEFHHHPEYLAKAAMSLLWDDKYDAAVAVLSLDPLADLENADE
jgi:hypothetical protein